MAEQKSAGELQEHMLWTYYGLRVGLATVGVSLPIVVGTVGYVLHDVPLASSISQYYHEGSSASAFATRDLLVGGLFGAAGCLYLYKGFSNKENIALNLAGIFAVLVALLPTAPEPVGGGFISKMHGAAAVLFFACIAYVSVFRAKDTLPLLASERRPHYERLYRLTGIAMIASPVTAAALSVFLEPKSPFRAVTFWMETAAVCSFSAYWIVKTNEMRESSAEQRSLDGKLERILSTVPLGTSPSALPSASAALTERIVAVPDDL